MAINMIWNGIRIAEFIDKLKDPTFQIQPNGIDLTVHSISEFTSSGDIDFDNSKRILPQTKPLGLKQLDDSLGWIVPPGGYLVRYCETVKIPPKAIGLVFPRSSLMRMGAMIHTAVWDSGYNGQGLGLLTVFNPCSIKIQQEARIAQLIFLPAASNTMKYEGVYQGEKA